MSQHTVSSHVNRDALDVIARDALALVHHLGLPLESEQVAKVVGRLSPNVGQDITESVLTFWDQVIPDGWKVEL